jgi:hypothetical protein
MTLRHRAEKLPLLEKICEDCDHDRCYVKHFQQNFESWTSGNEHIDKFIQNTQLLAHGDLEKALEWIPYDRFCDINYDMKTGMYKAKWIDGYIFDWNEYKENWTRLYNNMLVALKSLNNPKKITLEFMNEVLNEILKISFL